MTDSPLKIASWNVNGLRSVHKKGFFDWLETCGAEIIGLQETRVELEQLTEAARTPEGWHFDVHAARSRKGYSGVGYYTRYAPDAVEISIGEERFDIEGRVQILRFGALTIANVYFPNGSGKNRDHSRVPYKLEFYQQLFDLLEPQRAAGEPVIVMGDFNTAHAEIDLARPKTNHKTSGFLPIERDELDRWLRQGWTDTFRAQNPDTEGAYSWWSNRRGVRERNVGWRIDYVLASPGAMKHVQDAWIAADVLGSDHCPVGVTVDRAILNG